MKNTNKPKKLLIWCAVIAVIVAAIAAVIITDKLNNRIETEISIGEAQKLVDKTISTLPKSISQTAKKVLENIEITVNDLEYGDEKDIILHCTYSTIDLYTTVKASIDELFGHAYGIYLDNKAENKKTNATTLMIDLAGMLNDKLENAEKLSGDTDIYIYQTNGGELSIYLSDDTVNTCFGGIIDAIDLINSTSEITYKGETVSIKNLSTLRSGLIGCIALTNYDSTKPDTGSTLQKKWNSFKSEFSRNFVAKDQWKYLASGLLTTLEITLFAVLIGIFLGFLVAVVRVTNQKTGKLPILNKICQIYLSIIRGTPVMVQLLIIYFVILLPIGIEKFPAAVLCFGINSGAYVSEIVRGGIMSVDNGQSEAGRSLGFNYTQTMIYIVIPQAFKAVLPALANEFITLLKESSVAFYIGVSDLTQGGLKIRSITYSNFMPLIAVAVIYLVVVLGLSYCVGLLEKRLHKSDR